MMLIVMVWCCLLLVRGRGGRICVRLMLCRVLEIMLLINC